MMIFSGVLERRPRLRLVLAESGIGWLPYFVHRMDQAGEKHVPKAHRLPDQDEAERDLSPPGLRDVRGRATRPGAAADSRPRQLHVGLRLSAPRQHLPALGAMPSRRLQGSRSTRSCRRLRSATAPSCMDSHEHETPMNTVTGDQFVGAGLGHRSPCHRSRHLRAAYDARHHRSRDQRRDAASAQPARADDARGDHCRRVGVAWRRARRSFTTTSMIYSSSGAAVAER